MLLKKNRILIDQKVWNKFWWVRRTIWFRYLVTIKNFRYHPCFVIRCWTKQHSEIMFWPKVTLDWNCDSWFRAKIKIPFVICNSAKLGLWLVSGFMIRPKWNYNSRTIGDSVFHVILEIVCANIIREKSNLHKVCGYWFLKAIYIWAWMRIGLCQIRIRVHDWDQSNSKFDSVDL